MSPDPRERDLGVSPPPPVFATLPASSEAPADSNSHDEATGESDGAKRWKTLAGVSRREDRPEDTPPSGVFATPSSDGLPVFDGPEVPRDREAILHLVRMRALSYDQLARLTYHGVHKTVAHRRMRKLRASGWVHVWDKPVAAGSGPRYAYPTQQAFRWGHERLHGVLETPIGRLVEHMLPKGPRQPWDFKAGVTPTFLAHTEEVNDLAIAWRRALPAEVVWMSTWDVPFPEHIAWRQMPQPDYVLVFRREGQLHLVFGEHDRSTEPVHELARKLGVYRAWFETPDVLAETLGFSTFTLLLSVTGDTPMRRLIRLSETARDCGAAAFTRLSLFPWAVAQPHGATWFHPDEPPTSTPPDLSGHPAARPLALPATTSLPPQNNA